VHPAPKHWQALQFVNEPVKQTSVWTMLLAQDRQAESAMLTWTLTLPAGHQAQAALHRWVAVHELN